MNAHPIPKFMRLPSAQKLRTISAALRACRVATGGGAPDFLGADLHIEQIRDAELWAIGMLSRAKLARKPKPAVARMHVAIADLAKQPRAAILATPWRALPWSTRAHSVLEKPGTPGAPPRLRATHWTTTTLQDVRDIACSVGWRCVRGCGSMVNREITYALGDLGLVGVDGEATKP
jgi:hypothetical protein